jgi:hypothetical protein
MTRIIHAAVFAAVVFAALSSAAQAHAIAGSRVFPATLTIDDPAVADEASLPTVTYQPHRATDGTPYTDEIDVTGEFDKRITEHLGVAINDGYSILKPQGMKSLDGWQNLAVTLKYQAVTDTEHEFITSFGVIKQFGGTGAERIGAATAGTTTPTIYAGKGLGDLPDSLDYLRPLAITGTFGYQFADERTQTVGGLPALQFSTNPDQLVIGASIQYSLPYLQSQIRDIGLGDVLGKVVPLVEFAYSTPATQGFGATTQGTIAPGFIYIGRSFQVGIEALIPATKATGNHVGMLAQVHVFFDDLFPTTLGKPIFGN